MAYPKFPKECSDCGHLEPDGRCEVCRPCEGLNPPSAEDMLAALRVISYFQVACSTPGQIELVETLRSYLEVGCQEARYEIRAKIEEDIPKGKREWDLTEEEKEFLANEQENDGR